MCVFVRRCEGRGNFVTYRERTFLGSGDILAGPCELNHEANGFSLELRYDFRLGLESAFGCTKEWEMNGNSVEVLTKCVCVYTESASAMWSRQQRGHVIRM